MSVATRSLRSGTTKSCGCLKRDRAAVMNRKHGRSHTPGEYLAWVAMKTRCYNPNDEYYERYGGRGITVCDRWRSSFDAFVADVGPKPSPKHSIDRIDNDGNYEPGNCQWSDDLTQALNRSSTVFIAYGDRRQCATAWAKEFGTSIGNVLRWHRQGMTVADMRDHVNTNQFRQRSKKRIAQ